MNHPEYVRTDLAAEAASLSGGSYPDGVECKEKDEPGLHTTVVNITNRAGELAIGKPRGSYITLFFDRPWADEVDEEKLVSAMTEQLAHLLERSGKKVSRILVVGLGNRAIAADAIGPVTCDALAVDVDECSEDACPLPSAAPTVCAISPGVMGQTGIETAALVKSAIEAAKPSHVIAVDALAARSADRLCRTVQFSNTGIAPGSGVGNRRAALNEETLGVPVIALGVPSIVDSSTLVYETLEKAGIEDIAPPLVELLENNRSFFVTLKDCDAASGSLAALIAGAINRLPERLMKGQVLSYT